MNSFQHRCIPTKKDPGNVAGGGLPQTLPVIPRPLHGTVNCFYALGPAPKSRKNLLAELLQLPFCPAQEKSSKKKSSP